MLLRIHVKRGRYRKVESQKTKRHNKDTKNNDKKTGGAKLVSGQIKCERCIIDIKKTTSSGKHFNQPRYVWIYEDLRNDLKIYKSKIDRIIR